VREFPRPLGVAVETREAEQRPSERRVARLGRQRPASLEMLAGVIRSLLGQGEQAQQPHRPRLIQPGAVLVSAATLVLNDLACLLRCTGAVCGESGATSHHELEHAG